MLGELTHVPSAVSGQPTDSRADLARFLSVLWPEGSLGERWLHFWSLPLKRSEWTQVVTEETLTMLETWAEKEDVYLGVCARAANLGPNIRGDRDACVAPPRTLP